MTQSGGPLGRVEIVHVGQLIIDDRVENEDKGLFGGRQKESVEALRAQLVVVEVEMVEVQLVLQVRHLRYRPEEMAKDLDKIRFVSNRLELLG